MHPIEVPLRRLREVVKDAFRTGLSEGRFEDLAFIGNTGDTYPWTAARMMDLDILLFVREIDSDLGLWLWHGMQDLKRRLGSDDIDFEARVVEGPYKPPAAALLRPVVVAHLGIFTAEEYLASPPLKRWSWKKYLCERQADRLRRWAPSSIGVEELLHGRKGVSDRRRAIASGRVRMREWLLPSLEEVALVVTAAEPNFAECCFAYAAVCARNHGRVLAMPEADRLPNPEFYPWYDRRIMHSGALMDLMRRKERCRDVGFDVDLVETQGLCLEYLASLEARLTGMETSHASR